MAFWNRNKKEEKPQSTQRNYDASKIKLINANWPSINYHPDSLLRADLQTLQARCREAVRNDEYAHKAMLMIRQNVVGPYGIRLRAQAKNAGGKLDQPAIDAIEREWKTWGRAKYAHISRRNSWVDIQNLVIGSVFVDGEAFVRLHKGSYANEAYKFAVQVVDPYLVDAKLNIEKHNQNTIIGGIEYDRYMRPVAYWLSTGSTKGPSTNYTNTSNHERVPATDMLHIFIPLTADAKRGQPAMVPGLENLHNLKEFKKSALLASRLGAAKSIFLTEDDQGDSLTQEDIEDLEDNEVETINWNPESLTVLPNGTDIKSFDPSYPNQMYEDFVRTNLQAFASSVNLSYNSLAGDLANVNFSSLKTGKSEERQGYRTLQNLLMEHLHIPVYESWLRQQLIHNTILIGETPLKADRFKKYSEVKWNAPSWEPIDAVKEAQADALNLSNGTTTRSKIIAKSGADPDELFAERADEEQRLNELGLDTVEKTNIQMNFSEEGNEDQ